MQKGFIDRFINFMIYINPLKIVLLKVFVKFLDILYPHRCPSCKKIVEDAAFCEDCWKQLKFIKGACCVLCGRMLDANNSYGVVCVDCLESKYYFDRAFSVFNYEKIIASVILKFKFSRKMFLSKFLAKFLFMKYKEIDERIDYIIPVPMHIKKLRQRGYNQSLMLAYELSKLVNIPCVYDMLLKQKNTRAQIGSSHIARKRNLKSAFSMKEKYKGLFFDKNVLIVDDVMTTGTTASECAKVLKTNGIGKVFVLSVAKTQNNSSLARYKKAIKKMFIYKEIIEGESLEKVPSLVQNSPHS